MQLAVQALQAYNSYELTKLPPDGGGRDQQTVEWNTAMDTCFAAKSKAEEDREIERIADEAQDSTETPEYIKSDEVE